jgi:choline dehydrogenase-like flavoprotein
VITHERVAACVVGLGAAGGVVAAELAARGVRVVGLESGPAWDAGDFHDDEVAHIARRRLMWDEPEVMVLDGGPPVPAPWIARNVGVGGPNVWAGFAYRLHPSDFAGWPVTYDEMAPWYERAEALVGVREVAPGPGGVLLERAARELGWHPYPPPAAIGPSCDRCGTCTFYGCHTDAKFSTRALLGEVEVRAGAHAVEITRGRPRAVRYVDGHGDAHEQPADAVVLACNAPYAARLLMLSGIATGNDVLGRYATFHTGAFAYGVYDDVIDAGRGPAQHVGVDDFNEDRCPVSARGAVLHGGMAAAFTGGPLAFARGLDDTIPLPDGVPRAGAGLLRWAAHTYRRHQAVYVLGEDLPQWDNRVTLDPVVRDSRGQPALRIEYSPHPEDSAQVAFALERAVEWLERSGAREVAVAPSRIPGGIFAGHAHGVTRMGDDPATSVTDSHGLVHGTGDLFVLGAGGFVTSAGRNPALTIVALALRAADRIAAAATARPGVASRPRRP